MKIRTRRFAFALSLAALTFAAGCATGVNRKTSSTPSEKPKSERRERTGPGRDIASAGVLDIRCRMTNQDGHPTVAFVLPEKELRNGAKEVTGDVAYYTRYTNKEPAVLLKDQSIGIEAFDTDLHHKFYFLANLTGGRKIAIAAEGETESSFDVFRARLDSDWLVYPTKGPVYTSCKVIDAKNGKNLFNETDYN